MKSFKRLVVLVFSLVAIALLASCGAYGHDTYKVTFFDGDNELGNVEVEWGKKIEEIPTFTKKGYTFDYWCSDKELKNKFDFSTEVTEVVNLYSKWNVNSYTVTFKLEDGTTYQTVTQNYQTTISVTEPTSENQEFVGWYKDLANESSEFNMKVPASNITVYAKFEDLTLNFKFKANASDVKGDMADMKGVTAGTKLAANTYTRSGYTFVGWALEPDGEVAYQDNQTISSIDETKTVTLYAKWAPIAYSVIFVNYDGTQYEKADGTSYTYQGDFESQIAYPEVNPTRTGYTFLGWFKFQLTNDTTFQAEKVYYVNDGNDSSFIAKEVVVNAGDAVTANTYYEAIKSETDVVPLEGIRLYALFIANEYTITFVANGGSEVAPLKALYGTRLTAPLAPTKEGYTFVAWYTEAELTNHYTFTTMPLDGATLYAKWEAVSYTLTYTLNGGEATNNASYNVETETFTLANPTKTGYTFLGWTGTGLETPTLEVKVEKGSTGNKEFTANFQVNQYTINFNTNGGSEVTAITADYNAIVEAPANPTKEGHTFAGWFADEALTKSFAFSQMPLDGATLYAKWTVNQYTVTFDTKGGSGVANVKADFGTELTAPTTTKQGYVFVGWFEENAETPYVFATIEARNVELEARWTPATDTKYTVKHYLQNVNDDNYTLSENDNEEKEGTTEGLTNAEAKQFAGFHALTITQQTVKADGTTVVEVKYDRDLFTVTFVNKDTQAEITKVENVKYEATLGTLPQALTTKGYEYTTGTFTKDTQVKQNLTVEVEYTPVSNSVFLDGEKYSQFDYGTEVVIPNPTKIGYEFTGWLEEGNAHASTFTMPDDNVYLTSTWTANNYTVTCDLAGGELAKANPTSYTIETESFNLNNPTRVGYTFLGWTGTDLTEVTDTVTVAKGSTGNKEFTANWKAIEYTLTCKLNGGEATNKATYTIETETFTLNNPTKVGYTFLGWTGTDLTEVTDTVTVAKGSTGHKEFTANFQVNQYTITFVTNGGSEVTEITQDYETTVTKPADPTRIGYTFAGWFADEALETAYTFGTMPLNGTTLYAKWTPVAYALTYKGLEGAQLATANSASYTIETATFTLNNPTKVGYTFAGWKLGEAAANTTTTVEKGSYGDKEFTATWAINSHTLTFVIANQDPKVYTNIVFGSEIILPEVESYYTNAKMYVFKGFDKTVTTMPDEDITFTAKYSEYDYTIRFINSADSSKIAEVAPDSTYPVEYQFTYNYVLNLYKKSVLYKMILEAAKSNIDSSTTAEQKQLLELLGGYAGGQVSTDVIKSVNADLLLVTTPENQSYLLLLVFMANPSYGTAIYGNLSAQDYLEMFIQQTDERYIQNYIPYQEYEKNAYYPVGLDETYAFNEWRLTPDYADHVVTYTAMFYHKLAIPQEVTLSNLSAAKATFTWDAVEGAESYDVYVNGAVLTTNTNSITIDVENGQTYDVEVVAVNVPATSEAKVNLLFADQTTSLTMTPISLNSEKSEAYTHVHSSSDIKDTAYTSGSNYYIGASSDKLIIFTGGTYGFGKYSEMSINGSKLATLTYDESEQKFTLKVGDTAGTIHVSYTLKEDGTEHERDFEIRNLPNGIALNETLVNYNLTTGNLGSTDFFNTENVTRYQIGLATTKASETISNCEYKYTYKYTPSGSEQEVSETYYNGFSFRTEIVVNRGTIDGSLFDLGYTFYKMNASGAYELVTDTSDLYLYDQKQDAFYFLEGNEGSYKVEISYKKDTDEYTNSTLPMFLKEDERFNESANVTFEFDLNTGVNVYTHEQLRSAVDNAKVTGINIHSDIEAKLAPNQVSYVPFAASYIDASMLPKDANGNYVGELDITNAVMSTTTTNSPKIWNIGTKDDHVFQDKDGLYYKYVGIGGTYAIESCDWIENYESGKFFINNATIDTGRASSWAKYGMRLANIYERTCSATAITGQTHKFEYSDSEELTINGNYFNIDGSKLPYAVSTYHVELTGQVAAYEVQSCVVAIFSFSNETKSTINNLSIEANTMDVSSYLNKNAGQVASVAEYMSRTSGGFNAIRTTGRKYYPYNEKDSATYTYTEENKETSDTFVELNNVAIKNSLIALYVDYNSNLIANYTHIKDTWANTCYSHGGDSVRYNHCWIETSGGGSTCLDDSYFTYNQGVTLNPKVYFDRNTRVENYISGEEPWFKAYSMEVLALAMKSMIESNVNTAGFTIIKTIDNTEKMNLVFLGKDDPIENQTNKMSDYGNKNMREANPDDLAAEVYFGYDFITTSQGQLLAANFGLADSRVKSIYETYQTIETQYNQAVAANGEANFLATENGQMLKAAKDSLAPIASGYSVLKAKLIGMLGEEKGTYLADNVAKLVMDESGTPFIQVDIDNGTSNGISSVIHMLIGLDQSMQFYFELSRSMGTYTLYAMIEMFLLTA